MNMSLMLRYIIESAVIIPASIIAILPVYYSRKISSSRLFGLTGLLSVIVIAVGSVLCCIFSIKSDICLCLSMAILFPVYFYCFDLSFFKKLFCFANAVFLCGFSITYNTIVTAPLELNNTYPVRTAASGLAGLGFTIIVFAVFARMLWVKFPVLFENEGLDSIWTMLAIPSVAAAIISIWMRPVSAQNIMTGRIRMVCIVVLLVIPIVTFFIYQLLWRISKQITESADLQRNLDMMQMVEMQYRQTRLYLDESRNARHDFRQHLHVIEEYIQAEEYDKLKEYIAPIAREVNRSHNVICENQAVDAIANHYDNLARSMNICINWNVRTGANLPVKESNLCAVIGNLIENATQAVSLLTGEDRSISVHIGILQEKTLVISIDNPYKGVITLAKDGLPVSGQPGHGIGLRSVQNIVKRYGGSMEIETQNQTFNVSILMYAPD